MPKFKPARGLVTAAAATSTTPPPTTGTRMTARTRSVLEIPDSPLPTKRTADTASVSGRTPVKRFKPAPAPPHATAPGPSRRRSPDPVDVSSEVDSLNLGRATTKPVFVPFKFARKTQRTRTLPSTPRAPPPSARPPLVVPAAPVLPVLPDPPLPPAPHIHQLSPDRLNAFLSANQKLNTFLISLISDHNLARDQDIALLCSLIPQVDARISALLDAIRDAPSHTTPVPPLPAPAPAPAPASAPAPDTPDVPMSLDSPEFIDLDLNNATLVVDDPDDTYSDKFDPLPDDLVFLDADNYNLPQPSCSFSSSSTISVPAPSSTPASRIDHTSSPYYKEVISILKNTFKLSTFRTNQLECIIATLDTKDVFYLAPTGGGKSLCFQLPALCVTGKTQGTTFVISPLISLITDQVSALRKKGVPAFPLTSAAEENEVREAMRMMRSNVEEKPKLVYTTPERLQKSDSLKDVVNHLYTEKQLARFVIDEAHVIGSWGRDFRASYAELNILRRNWPDVPIMALTGSANKDAIEDIKHNLAMRDPVCLAQSFNRPNLHYSIRKKPALKKDLVQQIAGFIKTHHPNDTGIIYALSRIDSEEMAQKLRQDWGIEARHYHAGVGCEERKINQDDWMAGRCKVIVATIAFGMGIDKPDVRFVIHATLSKDMDGYYQETGRAGRDGRSSDCVLFYTYSDAVKIEKMLRNPNSNDPSRDKPSDAEIERQVSKLQGVVAYCCNESDCRRVLLLRHFDEEFKSEDCHNQCDNCHRPGTLIRQDFTAEARQVIQLLQEMIGANSRGVTPVQLKDTWKGKTTKTVQPYKALPLYACGKALGNPTIERIFGHLASEGVFAMHRLASSSGFCNTYIQLSNRASDYLTGDKQLVLSWKEREEDDTTKAAGKKPMSAKTIRKKPTQAEPRPKPQYLHLYDDIEDADDPDPSEDSFGDFVDNADASISEPTTSRIPLLSTSTPRLTRTMAAVPRKLAPAPAAIPEDEPAARLEALKATRFKIATNFNKYPEETILQDDTLQLLALTNPKDEQEFQRIMMDCEEPGEVHNKWHAYGGPFLAALRNPISKGFNTTKMHRDFAFKG